MTLLAAQAASNSIFLEVQKLNRYTKSEDFCIAFNKANDEQKKLLMQRISNGQHQEVLSLVQSILKENNVLETYSMKDLRKLAQAYCIPNWNFLTKDCLLKEIRKKKI